jgi:uncharacterized protein
MANEVIYFEIHAADPQRAQAFYRTCFDWSFPQWMEQPPYWGVVIPTEGTEQPAIQGGLMSRRGPSPEVGAPVNGYVCTVQVNSFDEAHVRIMAAGGAEAVPKFAMPGMAWQATTETRKGIFSASVSRTRRRDSRCPARVNLGCAGSVGGVEIAVRRAPLYAPPMNVAIQIALQSAAADERILKRLRNSGALAATSATALATESSLEEARLAHLIRSGDVVRLPTGLYYLDEEVVTSREETSGRWLRRILLALVVALVIVVALVALGA